MTFIIILQQKSIYYTHIVYSRSVLLYSGSTLYGKYFALLEHIWHEEVIIHLVHVFYTDIEGHNCHY